MDFVTVYGSFICFAIPIDTAVHDRVFPSIEETEAYSDRPHTFSQRVAGSLIMRKDIAILVSCIVVHGKIFAMSKETIFECVVT